MSTRRGSCPHLTGGGTFARRLEPARHRRDRDEGFSLVELAVTLLIVAIVIPLAFGLIKNLLQQSQNVHDTIAGLQQDQTAGESLLQYLHGTIVILPGSNATALNASILAGVDPTTQTPQTATLAAVLTNAANPALGATFTTSLTPAGGSTSSVGTYGALSSSNVFTYYYVSPTGGTASTSTPTNAQLSTIIGVGINVTFLAGPHVPTEGFQAVHPTTFATRIYLQNSAGAPAPTTTVILSSQTRSPAINSPLSVLATISTVPDGGTVTFLVTLGTASPVAQPVCTAPIAVTTAGSSAGTATCTFTPTVRGTYNFSATYSGTSKFQPSTSSILPINV